jgi:SAM-dependent methyltransferase
VEYRYSSHWIHELESETHWRLYWRQQKLMRELVRAGDRVLEIGVGTGFTANYLRSKGVHVTTLDIDAAKQPDIVANVAQYDFPESYDAIVAFEVFEHLPYDDLAPLLDRISTAAQSHVFLSLPRNRRLVTSLNVKLPKVKARTFQWKVRRGRIDEPYHVWELDHGGITVESLEQELTRHGFAIVRRDEAFDRRFYALASSSTS